MRYEIIHIQGTSVEDVTARMSALINTYLESRWEISGHDLFLLKIGEDTYSCVKEIIHR